MMMNLKGFGKKRSLPDFNLSPYSSGGTEENHEKSQAG
jgi:hypothetical protein